MLQQTTFSAVSPRFARFLDRFPDVGALAAATEDEVLAAWSGLGYYGRARNLRRAALAIVSDYAGRLPRDPVELRRPAGLRELHVGGGRVARVRSPPPRDRGERRAGLQPPLRDLRRSRVC